MESQTGRQGRENGILESKTMMMKGQGDYA